MSFQFPNMKFGQRAAKSGISAHLGPAAAAFQHHSLAASGKGLNEELLMHGLLADFAFLSPSSSPNFSLATAAAAIDQGIRGLLAAAADKDQSPKSNPADTRYSRNGNVDGRSPTWRAQGP